MKLTFLIAVALAIASRAALAEEKVTFVCSGFSSLPELNVPRAQSKSSIEIDLSAKTVTGFGGGPYQITKVEPTQIEFVGMFTMIDDDLRIAMGSMNRITGQVLVRVVKQNDPSKILMFFDEVCKPVRRLF